MIKTMVPIAAECSSNNLGSLYCAKLHSNNVTMVFIVGQQWLLKQVAYPRGGKKRQTDKDGPTKCSTTPNYIPEEIKNN